MNLFTYGTLMDPAVWMRVALEPCARQPATLPGYEARRLRGETFPGLVKCAGATTPGLLYESVSAAARARLDDYEGDIYMRAEVAVTLENGATAPAEVYLLLPEHSGLVLPDKWLPPSVAP